MKPPPALAAVPPIAAAFSCIVVSLQNYSQGLPASAALCAAVQVADLKGKFANVLSA